MPLLSVTDAANNIISLIGSVEGVLVAFPATNADGSVNTTAQNTAITDMVASLVNSGLFQLPAGASLDKVQAFAPMLVKIISDYKTNTSKTIIGQEPITQPSGTPTPVK